MYSPIKVIEIELSRPLDDLTELHGYRALLALVRLRGAPLGYVTIPLDKDSCSAVVLLNAISAQIERDLNGHISTQGSLRSKWRVLKPEDYPDQSLALQWPSVTVVVCTRDRVADLKRCLNALNVLDYANLEFLVIDNAPSNDVAERLVKDEFPPMRYVHEPRPGLDWARNRAIAKAHGEIIAFTDDDVVVDCSWVAALARVFAESPEVMAVTGLVVPYELETQAQFLFEQYSGFGKGFEPKRYHLNPDDSKSKKFHLRAGRFGTGANMAFRRSLFDKIGGFDPALDVGTVTHGGGDLEMFFRVIQEGYTLVYEPNAIVRHCHRKSYDELLQQLTHWGMGFYSYLVRSAMAYPDLRGELIRFGCKWLWKRNLRRMWRNFKRPNGLPHDLMWAQLRGSLIGLFRYPKARRIADEIAATFGPTEKLVPAAEDKGICNYSDCVLTSKRIKTK